MLQWLSEITDQPKATVIGAIIGAIITLIVAFLTILIKDYAIPIITEKRLLRNQSLCAYKAYSNPLILASFSFLYRTKEIFNSGNYLLNSTPKNEFNEYKYLSTIYRLCILLGWIHAIKIELSHIEVKNTAEFEKIEKALNQFEKSLADGDHIELVRIECLCKLWNLKYDSILESTKIYLGKQVELIIDCATFNEKVEIPKDLKEESKYKLAKDIADLICEKSDFEKVPDKILKKSLVTALEEMSRIESWIYRDWQSAIGELMIEPNSMGQIRKYDVIGYQKFENLCFKGDSDTKKWLGRVEALFNNLDVKIDNRFDARKQQLVNTYNSVINLIETFSQINKSNVDVTKTNLQNLKGKLNSN